MLYGVGNRFPDGKIYGREEIVTVAPITGNFFGENSRFVNRFDPARKLELYRF
jgi:hypothetical protein